MNTQFEKASKDIMWGCALFGAGSGTVLGFRKHPLASMAGGYIGFVAGVAVAFCLLSGVLLFEEWRRDKEASKTFEEEVKELFYLPSSNGRN
jgi:hypothetical protein